MTGQVFPRSLCNLFLFRVFFGLCSVPAYSFIVGLYDLVLVSVVSPLCRILQCWVVNARDVHDEPTADSLLCLLLDLLVNAILHTTTSTKCFA